MIIRRVDASNDWRFGKGKSDYATDEDAIDQNVQSRILSWLNDCFFALDEGVDWRSHLDVGEQGALLDDVRSVILKSYGVIGVNDVEAVFDSKSRAYTLTYDMQTIFSRSFQSALTLTVNA